MTFPNLETQTPNPDVSVHDLHKLAAMEAVLFAAQEPLPLDKLAEILQLKASLAAELLQSLLGKLNAGGGISLAETPDGFRLFSKPEFADYVERLREPQRIRLSKAALETLAIIAYRQPLTRAEIDQVRGVDSSGTVQTLVERGLIDMVGRREGPGRPVLYGTSQDFLEHFGMRDLLELPELPDSALPAGPPELFDQRALHLSESAVTEVARASASDEHQPTETNRHEAEASRADSRHEAAVAQSAAVAPVAIVGGPAAELSPGDFGD